MSMRSEMVHLGAVGGVVVDDDQHPQSEPRHGLEVSESEHGTPVAEGRDSQTVRTGHRCPDGASQTEAYGLKRLGEHEGVLVKNAQVHRRIAHEVARIDGYSPLDRQPR